MSVIEPKRIDSFRAIATAYRQFEFRSRLEAKWAAFFDLCGWSWSYEPIDLCGWIPDFVIGEWPTLVEIKPFFKYDDWTEAKHKIIKSGCRQSVILLGADPVWLSVEAHKDTPGCVWSQEPTDAPIIGWVFDPVDGEHPVTYHLNFGRTEGNDKLGLCPMDGPWRNEIWKMSQQPGYRHSNKDCRVNLRRGTVEMELVDRWARACNISQWVPLRERS